MEELNEENCKYFSLLSTQYETLFMKNFMSLFVILIFLFACSDSSNLEDTIDPISSGFEWTVPENSITGSFNPFPLAIDPTFRTADEIDFIAEESLVAIISFKNEINVYPYQYINRFESVNDKLKGINFSLTYCPITQSALCWDRNFQNSMMVLRASGYLLHDNMVAHDAKSDTYWSQIGAECIKGKYAGETNKTYNVIETKWKIVKEYFSKSKVFTNSSIANKSENITKKISSEMKTKNKLFGIIEKSPNGLKKVYGYNYSMFEGKTKLYERRVASKKVVIIGNSDLHFITAHYNDSNAEFSTINGQFPTIMKDDNGNKWNIFGVAVSGPRKGDQLESPTNLVALLSAWQDFYSTFIFEE